MPGSLTVDIGCQTEMFVDSEVLKQAEIFRQHSGAYFDFTGWLAEDTDGSRGGRQQAGKHL